MTMLTSMVDLHIRMRDHVFYRAEPDMRFAFDIVDAIDVGDMQAGELFEQNEDFWLFEIEVEDVGRAGPGMNSPKRCSGSLSITLCTKAASNAVPSLASLETVARWFENQTIHGIRFRSFLPVRPAKIQGFTAYSGVMNCDFEIQQ
jgi:hypothetical protein